ncbi:amidohydrolase family protein [Nocardioides aurantiacus]|uniref:amidohydrolase family protein n=1 Tax=Nocardioides aurantiacus TaxID=86796 RepID=UPI00403F3C65
MALHLHGHFLPDEELKHAWIVEGRLTFQRPPRSHVDSLGASVWVLPGLVDAHCHVGISPRGFLSDPAGQAEQMLEDRDVGALLLRDAGSPVDVSHVAGRDDLPELIHAGRHIARTKRYIRGQGVEVEPEDLVAEVERQVRASDGWVKIAADWIDRDVGELTPTFPRKTLTAAVERAHALGARVAVHAFAEETAADAVAARVDSIEHATGLTDDLLDQACRQGTAIVPTLINIDQFHAIAQKAEDKFPTYARHMRALSASSRDRVRSAWESGVQIYTGTDAGTLPHGLLRYEILALVGAGIPLADVVGQASWRGREWLGRPGLVEGAPADLLVFDADPRSDLTVLYRPRKIVLRGEIVR